MIHKYARILAAFALLIPLSLGAPAESAANSAGEQALLSHIRQLTFEGRRSGEGYFSPDGNWIVFQSEREPGNPFYQIYRLDLRTGETTRISPGIGKTTCAFFRPGRREILFASTHLDPDAVKKQKEELAFRASGRQRRYSWDFDERMDIFTADWNGGHLRRLTRARGYDAEGSYSPGGDKIVFTSTRDGYPAAKLSPEDRQRLKKDPSYFAEIYLMNADGSDQRRLTFWPGYDGGPFFSPDGGRIVWRHFNESGTIADIYTMNLQGGERRRVTDFGCMSWAPFYHPSGECLIFTANKLGFSNFELYLVDRAGAREPVRVTFSEGFDGLPTFSPDGRKLCWTSTRGGDGQSQLYLADWKDAAARAALAAAPRRISSSAGASPAGGQAIPTAASPSAVAAGIVESALRQEVSYLASPALEGRMTGSPGAKLAADFIADQLRAAGLRPFGTNSTFFQPFQFTSGLRALTNQNSLSIASKGAVRAFTVEKDFRPLPFTSNGEFEGDVVFAGYGLYAPGSGPEGYNSYRGVDVTNKIALILRYVPENITSKRRQELNRYAALRYKAMIAREHGARAILVVTGPNSPKPGALAPLSSDTSLAGSQILAASISLDCANALLQSSGHSLKELQTGLDSENPHAEPSFSIPSVRARLRFAVEHLRKPDRNVLGFLPPNDRRERRFIALGAHYDHLGHGEVGSLQRPEETGRIHPGADDNASGVAAVLEIAKALSAQRARAPSSFREGVLFALWSGEELGLIGSSYFADHAGPLLSNMTAYVNFDMVGRLRQDRLMLQGVGSSTNWNHWIEKENVPAGFNIVLQSDPYLPTDVTAFYPKGIPALNFFTGSHEDYHRPTDTADKINYEGLARIARFADRLVRDLVRSPVLLGYSKVKESAGAGARENLRVYLGTIPDYAVEVAGVKLAGVRPGGPADKGGLRAGDVIVEFGGQKIANIYDYTYALDAAKIGQPVSVKVRRDGREVTLRVIPQSR